MSASTLDFCLDAAGKGHEVHLVTNSGEVEPGFRQLFQESDQQFLDGLVCERGVFIHQTKGLDKQHHIPYSQCYVTKLFGIAGEIISGAEIDLILGWYFEPYGFAAALLGKCFGKRVFIVHAGSDLGRLNLHEDLRLSYRWMVESATGVVTTRTARTILKDNFQGALTDDKVLIQHGPPINSFFRERAEKLDIQSYIDRSAELYSGFRLDEGLKSRLDGLNSKPFDYAAPTVGIYGKVGPSKGSYDLISALKGLAERGVTFNFVSLSAGTPRNLARYYEGILSSPELSRRSWVLPPLPPWRVPQFIKLCDMVCFLENGFPIPFHRPRVPFEVLFTGACLVCSGEVADNLPYKGHLLDGKNFVLVRRPGDADALASRLEDLITDPARASVIGAHGKLTARYVYKTIRRGRSLADIIGQWGP